MELLAKYFNAISPLSSETWEVISTLFEKRKLTANEFFVEEHAVAKEIAFLESGSVRAFFTNKEAKEYNKQFFVGAKSHRRLYFSFDWTTKPHSSAGSC